MGKCDSGYKTGMHGGSNPYVAYPTLGEREIDGLSRSDVIPEKKDLTHSDVVRYQTDVMARYDSKELLRACDGFTRVLQGIDLTPYPMIESRIGTGVPISAGEMAEFIDWTNRGSKNTISTIDILLETEVGYVYDPNSGTYIPITFSGGTGAIGEAVVLPPTEGLSNGGEIAFDQRHSVQSLIIDYQTFLAGNVSGTMIGAFCSIFANPYKMLDKINRVMNFKIPTMAEIVSEIRDKIVGIIGAVIETIQRKFDNLKQALTGIRTNAFARRIQGVEEMFKPEAIEDIKKTMQERIDDAFASFKEITQDVLAFLMFRFCKLSSGVEFDLMAGVKQLEQMKKTYEVQKYGVRASSELRSQQYVSNGAVRYSSETRISMRNQAISDHNSGTGDEFDNLVSRVIMQESRGDPNAVNKRTGASGLMQIMPDTARDPGFGVTPMDWNKRFDPVENRRFGTEYLRAMLKRYDGDTTKALIAYNYGVGKADRWDGNMSSLPVETQNYVRNIQGAKTSVTPSNFVANEITEEERSWVASLTSAGDAAFSFEQSVITMGKRATEHWKSRKLDGYNAADNYDDAGWKHVAVNNPSVYIMLRRVHKRMGIKFRINSAYRSYYYNKYLTSGAAKNSPHSKAMALDVSTRNMSTAQKVEFIKCCSQEGFSRISVYPTFIHIDIGTGGRGDWTKNYNGSNDIREAIRLHIQDKFRRG